MQIKKIKGREKRMDMYLVMGVCKMEKEGRGVKKEAE